MDEGIEKRLRLLLVEDSPDDAQLLVKELRRGRLAVEWQRVENAEQMRAALESGRWDLVISDYSMPGFGATAALRLLRGSGLDLPFIIVSGTIDETTAVAAMKAGAHDYLTKGNLARLVPAVRRELREAETRRERNAAEARIKHLAYHDALTNLPNRIMFTERLKQAMFEADRNARRVGVMFVDLDRFKQINDNLGHDSGDELLRRASERLSACVRGGDTVARLGGDEFTVILRDLGTPEDAASAARKLLDCMARPFEINGRELYVTASIGISLYPTDDRGFDGLIKCADAAMYRAKEFGRNNFQFFSADMFTRITGDLGLETELRHALARDQIEPRYQPIVELRSGRIVALEALACWNHPQRGPLPAAEFIALAESTGLVVELDAVILAKACRQARAWRAGGLPPTRLLTNVSALQFSREDYATSVLKALAETDTDPEWIGLELTESAVMKRMEVAVDALGKLAGRGVWLAIDDFGTGFSSLSKLKHLPVHAVKIDRSFVDALASDADDAAIVKAIVAMCHSMNLTVIAEGAETPVQLDVLRTQGCDAAQGSAFSMPMTAEACERVLRVGRWPLSGGNP